MLKEGSKQGTLTIICPPTERRFNTEIAAYHHKEKYTKMDWYLYSLINGIITPKRFCHLQKKMIENNNKHRHYSYQLKLAFSFLRHDWGLNHF